MTALTPFNPSPETTDALIDDLGSPDLTLRDVASSHRTTLEALTLWMTRPDIATRINNIESAVARRTRLIATNFLPSTVQLLNQILTNQHEEEREPATTAERRRSRDSARKAATLLYRLARFAPGAAPAPNPSSTPSAPSQTRGFQLTPLGWPGGPRRSSAPSIPSSSSSQARLQSNSESSQSIALIAPPHPTPSSSSTPLCPKPATFSLLAQTLPPHGACDGALGPSPQPATSFFLGEHRPSG